MNTKPGQMIDSSAAFYLGLVDFTLQRGKCQISPNPFTSEYVHLKSWYHYQPEEGYDFDCHFALYRWRN